MTETSQESTHLLQTLKAVLKIGLQQPGHEHDCQQVLGLMRELGPGDIAVLRADAYLALKQQDHAGAVRALSAVLEQGRDGGLSPDDTLAVRALLAVCLCARDDPAAQQH